jgi:endonuclease/exonuclease/phosphatase family metal-dependent hydrolase
MKAAFKAFTVAASLLISGVVWASDITIASWNIKRLGHGNQQSYPALAAVASKADLLAVQEVMTEAGIARLETALEKHTGEDWGVLVSHAIGSSSYKEMYAFAWRESAVSYVDGAVVYLDRGDRFIREPFSARFESRRDGSQVALATVHILYGDGVADRTPEIRALANYWEWMGEVYPETPRMLVGDFNLPPDNPAWAPLKASARPLITRGASTLSSKDGRYANLYDNIWVEKNSRLKLGAAGIIDFPRMIGWSHDKSRKHVSDHAPVYVSLGRASVDAASVQVNTPAVDSRQKALARLVSSNPPDKAVGAVRGNRNSMIYHRPDCPSYSRVGAKNRVEFASEAEARAAGYRIAGNCR